MVAQGRAGVGGAEKAPLPQDRQDAVDERLEFGVVHRRHDVEAVRRADPVPVGDVVGDLLGGARNDVVAAPATEPADDLARGEVALVGERENEIRPGHLPAELRRIPDHVPRQRPVEVDVLRIDADDRRQRSDGVPRHDQIVEVVDGPQRLGLRIPDDGDDAGEDLHGVGGPAMALRGGADALGEFQPAADLPLGREHRVGVLPRDVDAGIGGTRLHLDGAPLRGPPDVERAGHGEVVAGVVDGPDLAGVGEDAAGVVADDGVIRPRVPQGVGHVEEFAAAAIAVLRRGELRGAEVARGGR